MHNGARFQAMLQMTKFLAANQQIHNLKNQTNLMIVKCKKIQARCRKIFCMNKVRMSILRQIWNDQKHVMIVNLKKAIRAQGGGGGSTSNKKKDLPKKRHLQRIIRVGDDVRECALKNYFHLCKEKAAKRFIEWRVEQAQLIKDPIMRQALRLRRLNDSA